MTAVDGWAASQEIDVFAQIGDSSLNPAHLSWVKDLEPAEFDAKFKAADAIVAHAGMGTILSALQQSKPILMMPRREALHEQRNDHQLATVERFKGRTGVLVAMHEQELDQQLAALTQLEGGTPIGPHASQELLDAIRSWLNESASDDNHKMSLGLNE